MIFTQIYLLGNLKKLTMLYIFRDSVAVVLDKIGSPRLLVYCYQLQDINSSV